MWRRTIQYMWKRIKHEPMLMFAIAILILLLTFAIIPQIFAPYSYHEVRLEKMLLSPCLEHPLGTDQLGRDLLSRIVFGSRIVLYVMIMTNLVSLSIAIVLGLVAGYYGGMINQIIMRFIDIMLSFPSLLLALALINILGAGLNNAVLAIGISLVAPYVRLICGQVLVVKTQPYIESARALGVRTWRLMLRHVLPNILSPLIVQATFYTATAILGVAALSFLGLGAQPPIPEWGAMVYEGRVYLQSNPIAVLVPAFAISAVALAVNTLGELLRDVLEPRLLTVQRI